MLQPVGSNKKDCNSFNMEISNHPEHSMADRVTQLAFQIADIAASSDIEILCVPVGGEPANVEEIRACWFDLEQVDPADKATVKRSAEYLDGRGLLKRHPVYPNWVRPQHAAQLAKMRSGATM